MKSYVSLYLYGLIIILAGIFLQFPENSSFNTIKYTLGITLIAGSVFAFITSFAFYRKQVQFTYHEIHAFAMLAYGIALILFCKTLDNLIWFTTFLFIFYAFSEIIFCNWLFNLRQNVVIKVLVIRILLGFATGIGTIFAINFTTLTFQIFGLLFILVGINVMLYVPIMKESQLIIIPKVLQQ